jgi:hypothetical protein
MLISVLNATRREVDAFVTDASLHTPYCISSLLCVRGENQGVGAFFLIFLLWGVEVGVSPGGLKAAVGVVGGYITTQLFRKLIMHYPLHIIYFIPLGPWAGLGRGEWFKIGDDNFLNRSGVKYGDG